MSSMGLADNCCQPKIPNLNFPLVSIDKNIITFKISMDHRWVMAMKIEKPSQDLSTPMLHCPNVNSLVLLPISIVIIKINKRRKNNKTSQKHKKDNDHTNII